MTNQPKKTWFSVQENESIEECLKRMDVEGYLPIKRIEKPIFQEVEIEGTKKTVPIKREIKFQGLLKDE